MNQRLKPQLKLPLSLALPGQPTLRLLNLSSTPLLAFEQLFSLELHFNESLALLADLLSQ